MSYTDGMVALNLEMPDRVPRTEYSVEGHWDLIKTVTGIDVSINSSSEVKFNAKPSERLELRPYLVRTYSRTNL